MPSSTFARFVALYYSHIFTTIPIPIALLLLGILSPLHALSLVLFLSGFWTTVGALLMVQRDTRELKRLYTAVGIALVVGSVILWV